MTTYFVSNSEGLDTNNGITAPRKTLYNLQDLTFYPGDNILLKRSDFWREPSGYPFIASGEGGRPITLDCYGSGNAPKITSSALLGGWVSDGGGIYHIDYEISVEGMLENGYPLKKATNEELSDGSWFFNDILDALYYRPSSLAANDNIVEICRNNIISAINVTHITFNNIHTYGNSSGIHIQNSANINILNCIIRANSYVGIPIRSRSAEPGPDCANILIRGNTISWNANGVYLIAEGEAGEFQNVNVIGNLVEYNNYRKTWDHNTVDGHGIGIQSSKDCSFIGNEVRYNKTGPCMWVTAGLRMDNNIIARNFVHHNEQFGIDIGGEGSNNQSGNKICCNLVSDNGAFGAEDYSGFAGGIKISRSCVDKNWITHNTLVRNDVNIYIYSLTDYAQIENNLSHNPTYHHVKIAGYVNDNKFDKNLYYPDGPTMFYTATGHDMTFSEWKAHSGQDIDSLVGSPDFNQNDLTLPGHFACEDNSPALLAEPTNISTGDFYWRRSATDFIGAVC